MTEGSVIFNLIAAGALTFVLGWVALWRLQRAILHNMGASGAQQSIAVAIDQPRRAASVPLLLALEPVSAELSAADPT